ncbi:uncharacterized protein BDZ99DRAFT_55110 [Mytilinidion resinicola]|uniref:Uncharacterized protein n=1 Tax=Mytilinidion resinicola TaxID=574789 RepID=A0A6A6YIN2_9PEZI|nr:uncharacterized protein BDZ99DRAFT_55110 [Mytilinidion resinicola]KAF2808408.1 hypothetical protein BDZ99DRAFT_55110 [Mytilinidion resinicola]
MAEQITQDVVKEAQSMGESSPIDATATTTIDSAGDGEVPSDRTTASPKPSNALPTPPPSTSDAGADAPPSTDKAVEKNATMGGSKDADIGVLQADGEQFAVLEPPNRQLDPSLSKAEVPLVNGDAGDLSAPEDATSQHALAEVSGGSDTDISRPGSVDQANERPGRHLRSNSIQKPKSFKSVSVTKNFLAKAVTTPVARPGEKAPPVGQTNASLLQSAKPRLVAKSGSGLGSVMRTSLAKTNGAGSGPDATKVWNKNQPVPPPPPKQFTDEELKQQYGIHLATRLQADDTNKEAKWADIDDDEDDWAPETVEWMDGTKSTVNTTEAQKPPEEPKPSILRKETPEPVRPGPAPTAIQRPSSTGGTKTILKPGAHTSSTKSNLVLKGAPEKPTLVAKPSAPAQVKSPWAPLPPVEKVSPVQINPPNHPPPPSRFSQRDPHGFDALPPVPSTTKEFAPDDFNRSWRDERGNKELFNSHNGRYEPVNEMRRGSIRSNEFRQPSVLQRPSPQGAPAEPSAAFQTSRSSGDAPTWGRRRNSSNVSGGSGRRPSFAPDMPPIPLDMQHRRGSQSMTGSDIGTPGGTPRLAFAQRHHAPEHGISPAEQHHSWTQRSSPNISHVQPTSPLESISSGPGDAVHTPAQPVEDPVAVQKRLMQEKIERAKLEKKRQQEVEAKEEAARKERLRLKLEAMGMGESKDKPKEPSPSRAAEKSPQKERALPAPMQSPPKPPVPQSEGEVAQYGMMKVHQPHPVRKASHVSDASIPELRAAPKASSDAPPQVASKRSPSPLKALSAGEAPKAVSPPALPLHDISPDNRAPQGNNSKPQPPQLQQLEASEDRAAHNVFKERPPPTWTSSSISSSHSVPSSQAITSSQDALTAWSSGLSKAPSSSTNVWGPPHKALGNGTFETSFNRTSLRPASQQQLQASSSPGPIAPPSSLRLSPAQRAAVPTQSQDQSQSRHPHPPTVDMGNTRNHGTALTNWSASATLEGHGPHDNWNGYGSYILLSDALAIAKSHEMAKVLGDNYKHEIRERFTPSVGRNRKTVTTRYAPAGGHLAVQEPTDEAQSAETANTTNAPAIAEANPFFGIPPHLRPAARAAAAAAAGEAAPVQSIPPHLRAAARKESRYFAGGREDSSSQASGASQQSDSPPPPETQSHPVFDSDSARPKVNLPIPKAVVKLPPAKSPPVQRAVLATRAKSTAALGAQPLANTEAWQARFNGLFNKKEVAPTGSTGKPNLLAVAPATKAPLVDVASVNSATVSLPVAIKSSFVNDGSKDVLSRASPEDTLFDDRTFGSVPVVKLPEVPHGSASLPAVHARLNLKSQRPVDSTSKTELAIGKEDETAKGINVNVRVGNLTEPVTKTMAPRRNDRRASGYQKRSFPPRNNSNNTQNPRGRNQSGSYQGQGGSSQNTTPRPANNGSRSGSGNWNNRSNTNTSQQNGAWTKRVAPAVAH